MQLTQQLTTAIVQHAKAVYPNECCGVIVDGTYYPCQNVAHDPANHFKIAPNDFATLSALGQVLAIVHSHPNGTGTPSVSDSVHMGLYEIDWVIVGLGKDLISQDWYVDIQTHTPKPYHEPLLGRAYVHGVQDCYTLVQDYYKQELGIVLPNFNRQDNWWEDKDHTPLYESNFVQAGGVQIEPNKLQTHDVILCRVGRTHHINHALIFLGDYQLISETTPPCVGNSLILHHPHNRLSVREVYGEHWQKRTAMVVRHKDFL